jgi:hypothetical protein
MFSHPLSFHLLIQSKYVSNHSELTSSLFIIIEGLLYLLNLSVLFQANNIHRTNITTIKAKTKKGEVIINIIKRIT